MRRLACVMMLGVLVCLTGCAGLDSSYGESRGSSGRRSLNGFGGLRERFRREGFETRDVYRFNKRLVDSRAVVWTPKAPSGVSASTGAWLSGWLSRGNRTLIFVIPDSGSLTDYYETVLPESEPSQRLEYRRRLARAVNDEMGWRYRRNDLQVSPWFSAESLPSPRPIERRLTWSDPKEGEVSLSSTGDGENESPNSLGDYEYVLSALDSDSGEDSSSNTTVAGPTFMQQPVGPSTPVFSPSIDPYLGDSGKTWQFKPVLRSGPDVLIASVSSPTWNNSEILVVAGGSLLTNFALSRPDGREIADRLVKRVRNNAGEELGAAAFATSDYGSIPVRESNSDVPTPSGMEVLTTWPISLVTIHGLLGGLIFCLIVFPIFGRPRKTRAASVNHFGGHLDAVATLMAKTNGKAYAEARVSEYRRRVSERTS